MLTKHENTMSHIEEFIHSLGGGFRAFPLNHSLLLFNRQKGINVLLRGQETHGLRQLFPRVVQFGLSNACNLQCTFCSRDMDAKNHWTADSAFDLLAEMSHRGLLEVAFGGGEPLLFKDFVPLVHRLYDETALAVSFTSNGSWFDKHVGLDSIASKIGQVRLSVYDTNDWRKSIDFLQKKRFNFGINYLMTPARIDDFENVLAEWISLGIQDALILNYKGPDHSLHLSEDSLKALERIIHQAASVHPMLQLKLDICFGHNLAKIPRLHPRLDCDAGKDFLVITSDRKVQPCSFHHYAVPFQNVDDIHAIWSKDLQLGSSAKCGGCTRHHFKRSL